MNPEKTPYPPAYTEIYPAVPAAEIRPHTNIGWTGPPTEVEVAQPPPDYVTQPVATNIVLRNQSRIGLYPIKLQPCPHCQVEGKTVITQEATLKTHLLALILCVTCCCCLVPFAYCTNNMTKTANHLCENCNFYIGSYNRKWFK